MFVAADSDRVGYLVSLLFHSSIDVRVDSAALIEIVFAGIRSLDFRAQISDARKIFEGVVRLVLGEAASAQAVKAGAAKVLIDRLVEFEKCDTERVLASVELLRRIPSGLAAFAARSLTVPTLVIIILTISDRATEYTAGALLSLCSNSELTRREAMAAGVLTKLLFLVQSYCTERAKRKAQMLLKLLRDSWPEDTIANSDDFACSDVVPYCFCS
ncbi:U-box domain-containing 26-like [Olea europaea subsp. europaea]|uniref:U-box domain-containing 26-like n=1 Tax=Olea europaea subsp. europaea TaxID=158383 RepID=A0A8S0RYR4_OLEEU|nr:U-box domain-containing 26-like [Olea europaea subsp. europaea]